MRGLVFHVCTRTFRTVISNNPAPVRHITTTNFLAAKASTAQRPPARLKTKKMASPIDLTQDSDSEESDEDLKLAISMSLSQPDQSNGSTSLKFTKPDDHPPDLQPTGPGIMGLDRKQMEAERLARHAQLKRKRGDTDISPSPLSRRTRTKSPASQPSPQKLTSMETERAFAARPSQAPSSKRPSTPQATRRYPNGIIKRTWISSHPRTDRDITFSELIDAPNLKSALLSSFIWDFDWLFPHVRTKETNFVLVMHSQSLQHASLLKSDFASIPNIRLVFPPTSSIGCMHSKLLLLFYANHLRIAIPTANLTSSDWGECGRLENMLFVIDLPLVTSQTEKQNSQHPFYTSLSQFLSAQTVPQDVLTRLSTFDFAATRHNNIAFVHSIAGSHTNPEICDSTGLCGLGGAVRRMGFVPKEGERVQMDYACSSVGSLTEKFLEGLYAAASGVQESTGIQIPTTNASGTDVHASTKQNGIRNFFHSPKALKAQESGTEAEEPANSRSQLSISATYRSKLRIFFPSAATIAKSLGGSNAAGTICFQRRWWEGAKFPRGVLRDCVAVREGVLMHSKVLFVRFSRGGKGEERQDGEYAGWVYVGSANCSESAWGVLGGGGKAKVKGKSVGERREDRDRNGHVKLTCRNWECGVIVPVPTGNGKTGLDVFESVLPLPMVYPGASYEENSELEPWFFGEDDAAAS